MTDFIIRTPRPDEAAAMAEIEALGFAPAEAASLAQITARLAVFPEQFFVAEQDNRVVGFINGCSADTPHLRRCPPSSAQRRVCVCVWLGGASRLSAARHGGVADSEHGGAEWHKMTLLF